jgi:hypothetical protein
LAVAIADGMSRKKIEYGASATLTKSYARLLPSALLTDESPGARPPALARCTQA